MKFLCIIIFSLSCMTGFTDEIIPPVPKNYFNDYANMVSAPTVEKLNKQLEQFERGTSCQVVVAIFTNMQSEYPIKDYALRVSRAWKVGQKGKDNGVVLLIFTKDRKMYLSVGYGLEKALPNELCKSIIDSKIVSRFKVGDFDGGLTAGVNAILAATKDEYKGTGKTVWENNSKADSISEPTNTPNNAVTSPDSTQF